MVKSRMTAMRALAVLAVLAVPPVLLIAQEPYAVPRELPAAATTQLARSLAASEAHAKHVWRDTPPLNDDGTVNAYIEIARGDRRKWEFDMGANARAIDRVMPEALGGYPVNYGFVPQTVSVQMATHLMSWCSVRRFPAAVSCAVRLSD